VHITLAKLREIIIEEVERNLRWSAGSFMAGGIGSSHNNDGNNDGVLGTLNADQEQEDDNGKEQEKQQLAVRVSDRSKRQRRSPRT
jgi:hypothetical protein